MCTWSSTDELKPGQIKDRDKSVGPKGTESSTKSAEPGLDIPNTNTEKPKRLMLLKDNGLPDRTKSVAGSRNSKHKRLLSDGEESS